MNRAAYMALLWLRAVQRDYAGVVDVCARLEARTRVKESGLPPMPADERRAYAGAVAVLVDDGGEIAEKGRGLPDAAVALLALALRYARRALPLPGRCARAAPRPAPAVVWALRRGTRRADRHRTARVS